MPKKEHDWQIDSINNNTIPKLAFGIIKLDSQKPLTSLESKPVNWRLASKMPEILDKHNGAKKLLECDSRQLK